MYNCCADHFDVVDGRMSLNLRSVLASPLVKLINNPIVDGYGGGKYTIDYFERYGVLSTPPSVPRTIKLPPNISFQCVGYEALFIVYIHYTV